MAEDPETPDDIEASTEEKKAMIELITDLPDNVIGFSASGEVTEAEYETVLIPAIEGKLTKTKQVRLLYVLGEEFKGYTAGAAWDDTKVGLKHLTRFDRVAIVTDVHWLRNTAKALGFMLPCEVRVFDNPNLQEARAWISEPPPTGELAFEILTEPGVLILRPHGELEAADFERVAKLIDPYIDTHGGLDGVVIIAAHFPGWDDLSAFSAHLRFVREHRKNVKRLAIVTDDRLVAAVPPIASHLAVIEARHYPAEKVEEALAWVSQG